jgi:DNA-binding response OmpR family regulator
LAAPPPADAKSKKRVLVVEDDDAIATLLQKMLEARYEVKRTRNGNEALALVTTYLPNLVLLDVMMPGLDGYATAQQMRLLPQLKTLPIIFLTAKGGAMDVVKGIQSGARFYVTKPFKMDDLLAKVRKALGE